VELTDAHMLCCCGRRSTAYKQLTRLPSVV